MLLAIDVGNTQTVVGVYEGEVLAHMWRVATNKSHTSDELRVKVLPLLDSEGIAPDDLPHIFERGYGTDGGNGLGLYITKTILDHHGIQHSMVNTEDGVRFTTIFPKAAM